MSTQFVSTLNRCFASSAQAQQSPPAIFLIPIDLGLGFGTMSRSLLPALVTLSRQRSLQILLTVALLYVVLVQFPFLSGQIERPSASLVASDLPLPLASHEDTHRRSAPARPLTLRPRSSIVSSLDFAPSNTTALSELHTSVRDAFITGRKVFRELESVDLDRLPPANSPEAEENCPHSIVLKGAEFEARGRVMVLPCGLTLGSHITLVAKPLPAHPERDPKIASPMDGDQPVMVSQFMMELQGLKTVDGEDPPRILHFNPRLKGDWSERPVIEQNTCYRMQWGSALRCEGWRSLADEETVDGLLKCEKWIRDDVERSEESKMKWWLNRLIGRTQKVSFDWPYPFVENKLFVLTLSAGLEGYHVNVDGRHVTSFPYRTGFILEDATGLSVNGDLDVQSIYAASLPTSHPSFLPQRNLEMLPQWQSPPLPDRPVELFIGILSAGNHFAERMAVRRSWMSTVRESPNLVARFFVALHGRKEVNIELKKEAEFFGDIVIVPYMDSYDLVVMKTVAICEYGIRTVAAKYIMKCDDDTFVRIDSVMKEIKKLRSDKSLYIGNMNNHHKPLRSGKWAVTYEEWPEEEYPLYANGPGYVVSSDIGHFIVSEFEKHTLRLFKMEDVSMGMWVEQFNSTQPVVYVDKANFCQSGCANGYYTAHYQSPRQMICLWEKLKMGKAECCNMR